MTDAIERALDRASRDNDAEMRDCPIDRTCDGCADRGICEGWGKRELHAAALAELAGLREARKRIAEQADYLSADTRSDLATRLSAIAAIVAAARAAK